jgi:hypothetical protein
MKKNNSQSSNKNYSDLTPVVVYENPDIQKKTNLSRE